MSETTANTTSNGSKPTSNKGQNADVTPVKPQKKQRKTQSLPAAVSLADLNPVHYAAQVTKIAVPWENMDNYGVFSLSPDGAEPYIKVNRTKAVRLSDKKVLLVDGGNCYPVKLANLPILLNQP